MSEHDDSSDDFGSFSDASFEEVVADQPETTQLHNFSNILQEQNIKSIEHCINELFPTSSENSVTNSNNEDFSLEKLISSERPSVIYEQLVELPTVLQPFSWNKSHIKATLLHILRIPESQPSVVVKEQRPPLDDSLFSKICSSIVAHEHHHSKNILKERFKIKYIPSLTHIALQEEEQEEQEAKIPILLSTAFENADESTLEDFHDKLCHAIDMLYNRLEELQTRQEKLIEDKTTFENVVTNLSGHTQRLHRDEIAYYNKKKKNRFSWIGR